jgi:hypothetical protein
VREIRKNMNKNYKFKWRELVRKKSRNKKKKLKDWRKKGLRQRKNLDCRMKARRKKSEIDLHKRNQTWRKIKEISLIIQKIPKNNNPLVKT